MQVKLQKVGDAVGATFPSEILEQLNLKEGDQLTVVVMKDGIKLMACDSDVEKAMAAYKQGSAQYYDAMRELADG